MIDFNDDKHIDVCRSIEVGFRREYEANPDFTDTKCMFALDAGQVAIKQRKN